MRSVGNDLYAFRTARLSSEISMISNQADLDFSCTWFSLKSGSSEISTGVEISIVWNQSQDRRLKIARSQHIVGHYLQVFWLNSVSESNFIWNPCKVWNQNRLKSTPLLPWNNIKNSNGFSTWTSCRCGSSAPASRMDLLCDCSSVVFSSSGKTLCVDLEYLDNYRMWTGFGMT